jgi:MFS family permease
LRELGSPLRVPGFARLATSYAVNEFGDNLGIVALALLVLDGTDSALATAGLFLAARFAPALVAPMLTARVDRAAVRRSLPALYALETATFAGLALLAAGDFSLPAVLVLAFVDGTLALTARGLSRAAVATMLKPRGELRAGNALLNVAFAVTSAAGPAVAGVLVGLAGASAALWVDAASFAVIALLLVTSRNLPPGRPEDSQDRWWARVREGFSTIRGDPALRRLVAAQALAFVFFFLVIPIEDVYAKDTLAAGDAGYGALLAAWGVGLVIGSGIFSRISDRSPVVVIVGSTALVGVGYLGLAGAPTIVLACVASIVGGTGNGIQWVSVLTAIQEAVGDALQARVVGLMESIAAAAPGAGFIIGGGLAALWSPRIAYLVAGIGVVAVAGLMVRRAGVPDPR